MERKFTEDYAARCRAKNELNDKASKAWNEAKKLERAGNKAEAEKSIMNIVNTFRNGWTLTRANKLLSFFYAA